MLIIAGKNFKWLKLGLLVLVVGLVIGIKFFIGKVSPSPAQEASAAPTNWTDITVRIPVSDKEVAGDLNITNSKVIFEAPVNGDYAVLKVGGKLDIKANSVIYTGETALIGIPEFNNDRVAHPGLAGGTAIIIEAGDIAIGGTIDARWANNINITSNSDRNGGMTLPGAKGGYGGIPKVIDNTQGGADAEAGGGAGGGNGGAGIEGGYGCFIAFNSAICSGGAGGGGGFQGYGGLVGSDSRDNGRNDIAGVEFTASEGGTTGNSTNIKSRQSTITASLVGSGYDPIKALASTGGIGGRVATDALYAGYSGSVNTISSGGGLISIKATNKVTFSNGKVLANGIAGSNAVDSGGVCYAALGGGSGGTVYIKANEVVNPTIDVRGAPGGTGIYGEVNCHAGKGGGGAGGVVVLDVSNISSCKAWGVREEGYFHSGCENIQSADVVSNTISEGTGPNPTYAPSPGDILIRGGYSTAVDNKLLTNAGVVVFPTLVPSSSGFAQVEKHTYSNSGYSGAETATFNSGDTVYVLLKVTNPIGVGSATVTDEVPSGTASNSITYSQGGNGSFNQSTNIVTWSSIPLSSPTTELKYKFTMP